MEALREFAEETWAIPEARWVIWTAVLVSVLFIAIYVASFFRRLAIGENSIESGEDLSLIEQMRREGVVDDKEFENLKSAARSADRTSSLVKEETEKPQPRFEKDAGNNDDDPPGLHEETDRPD